MLGRMYGFIFKNKLGALAFVGMTLYGVATLVGSEEDDGLLQQGVESIQSERTSFEQQIGEFGDPEPAEILDADDEEDISLPPGELFGADEPDEFGFDPQPDDASSEGYEPSPTINPGVNPARSENRGFEGPSDGGEIVGVILDRNGDVFIDARDGRR